jgi:hypothetical protein
MTGEEIAGAKERLKKYDEEQAAKKAAAAKASTAPADPVTSPPSNPESPTS